MTKRIVLTGWWVGDRIYHRLTGDHGLITGVQFLGDKLSVRYYVVWAHEADGWHDAMELSADRTFTETGDIAAP